MLWVQYFSKNKKIEVDGKLMESWWDFCKFFCFLLYMTLLLWKVDGKLMENLWPNIVDFPPKYRISFLFYENQHVSAFCCVILYLCMFFLTFLVFRMSQQKYQKINLKQVLARYSYSIEFKWLCFQFIARRPIGDWN